MIYGLRNIFAIAKPGTEEPLGKVSLADIAEGIRFDSSHDRLSVVDGRASGGQLQAMRLLTSAAAALVEVKGIRGTILSFIITAREVRQARTNRHFILCAVTSALSDMRQMFRHTGQEFIQKFRLEEVAYKAISRK
jgi:hypothetical protein